MMPGEGIIGGNDLELIWQKAHPEKKSSKKKYTEEESGNMEADNLCNEAMQFRDYDARVVI